MPFAEGTPIDFNKRWTYVEELHPLNPLPVEGMTNLEWGELIGFGCDPVTLLRGSMSRLFQFDLDPNTGLPPQCLEQSVSKYEPHYKVAHGAHRDENIPPRYWCDWHVDTFLRERGLRLRGKYVRENSLRLLIRVLGLEDELKQRAPQPRE